MEPTGLDEECQLFKVRKLSPTSIPSHRCLILLQVIRAAVAENPTVTKDMPEIEYAMVDPPNLEWPRLRCFLVFKDEDPTKPGHGRVRAWCTQGLQDLYTMDKRLSRSAARLAIPQLLEEVNVLKKPQQTGERIGFKVALDRVFPGLPVEVVKTRGVEESVDQYIDRFLRVALRKNGGSES